MACSYPTTVCLNVHDVVRLYMQQLCGRHLVRKGRRVDVARRRFHFALKAMLNGPPTSSCLGFSKTSIATGLPQTARPRKETTHAERERSFPLPWGTDQRPRVHVQIQDARSQPSRTDHPHQGHSAPICIRSRTFLDCTVQFVQGLLEAIEVLLEQPDQWRGCRWRVGPRGKCRCFR